MGNSAFPSFLPCSRMNGRWRKGGRWHCTVHGKIRLNPPFLSPPPPSPSRPEPYQSPSSTSSLSHSLRFHVKAGEREGASKRRAVPNTCRPPLSLSFFRKIQVVSGKRESEVRRRGTLWVNFHSPSAPENSL